jgi:hypothetical protein
MEPMEPVEPTPGTLARCSCPPARSAALYEPVELGP